MGEKDLLGLTLFSLQADSHIPKCLSRGLSNFSKAELPYWEKKIGRCAEESHDWVGGVPAERETGHL